MLVLISTFLGAVIGWGTSWLINRYPSSKSLVSISWILTTCFLWFAYVFYAFFHWWLLLFSLLILFVAFCIYLLRPINRHQFFKRIVLVSWIVAIAVPFSYAALYILIIFTISPQNTWWLVVILALLIYLFIRYKFSRPILLITIFFLYLWYLALVLRVAIKTDPYDVSAAVEFVYLSLPSFLSFFTLGFAVSTTITNRFQLWKN